MTSQDCEDNVMTLSHCLECGLEMDNLPIETWTLVKFMFQTRVWVYFLVQTSVGT